MRRLPPPCSSQKGISVLGPVWCGLGKQMKETLSFLLLHSHWLLGQINLRTDTQGTGLLLKTGKDWGRLLNSCGFFFHLVKLEAWFNQSGGRSEEIGWRLKKPHLVLGRFTDTLPAMANSSYVTVSKDNDHIHLHNDIFLSLMLLPPWEHCHRTPWVPSSNFVGRSQTLAFTDEGNKSQHGYWLFSVSHRRSLCNW